MGTEEEVGFAFGVIGTVREQEIVGGRDHFLADAYDADSKVVPNEGPHCGQRDRVHFSRNQLLLLAFKLHPTLGCPCYHSTLCR